MTDAAKKHEATINDLIAVLSKGKVLVKFKKKDNTVSERTFTLNPDLIAESGYKFKTAEEAKSAARQPNPGILNVFQIDDTKAWKSFRRENLISFTVIEDKPAAPSESNPANHNPAA